MSIIGIHGDGRVSYYDPKTRKKVYVEPGWEKGWLFENVYGWQWIGSMQDCPTGYHTSVNLVVLPYEPEIEERKAIHEQFADAIPPGGGKEIVPDPFTKKSLSESQCGY